MGVLQKACIKIVAHAIYTYLFFSYTYTPLFCWKTKGCCGQFFSANQATDRCSVYLLQDYSN